MKSGTLSNSANFPSILLVDAGCGPKLEFFDIKSLLRLRRCMNLLPSSG